jgi:hypothetical protein
VKGYVAEIDGWTVSGAKITDPEKLKGIRATLEEKGPIILEHKFYRAARGPHTLAFDDYDEFINYLNSNGQAGDRMTVWSFWDVCKDDNVLAAGKCPDDEGRVPERGAY